MAYDIFHNYQFEPKVHKKGLKESFDRSTILKTIRAQNIDIETLQDQYSHGDKSPCDILKSLGYTEDQFDEHVYVKKINGIQSVFDFTSYDYFESTYVEATLQDEYGNLIEGTCTTKFELEEADDSWMNENCSMDEEYDVNSEDFMTKAFRAVYNLDDDDDISLASRE